MSDNNGEFNLGDLRACDLQYTVRFESTTNFNIDDIVFLKSNPDWPMMVIEVLNNVVIVGWVDGDGELQTKSFPPHCILQYEYVGLVTWKRKFNICLN